MIWNLNLKELHIIQLNGDVISTFCLKPHIVYQQRRSFSNISEDSKFGNLR